MLATVKNWSLVLGKANLKDALLIPLKFSIGRISFYPKTVYYLLGGGFTMVVLVAAAKEGLKKRFWSYLFFMTALVGTVFSIFTPMMQYFRFLFLIPILMIIIGKNKWVAAGFTLFSLFYLLNSNMWREDWRSTVRQINKNEVYMVASFGDPVNYYNNKIAVKDIRGQISGKEIWVIPYGEEIHGVDHKQILTKAGYSLETQTDFREMGLEKWSL